jgi:DNA repair exonuclease SbcCD nuclease subunit
MDLKIFQPEVVFLGHIHTPQNSGAVWYPGSPHPLSINETGIRRFLVFDTENGEVKSHRVNSTTVYFKERIVMVPAKNDLDLLRSETQRRIENWDIPQDWDDKVVARIEVAGTANSSRRRVLETILEEFSRFTLYDKQKPKLDELVHDSDPDKAEIAKRMKHWIDDLDWNDTKDLPSKSLVMEEALKIIFGE